jgi:hypothetical protein
VSDLTVHYTLHLPGQLPGLNEILEAAGHLYRGTQGRRTTAYQVNMKKPLTERVRFLAGHQRIQPVAVGCAYTFLLHEQDHRRDPDNAAGGAQKIILDALGAAGLMPLKDGWRGVLDLRQHWVVDAAHVGVTVIAAARVADKAEAVALAARAVRRAFLGGAGAIVIPAAPVRRRAKAAGAAAGGRPARGR